MAAAAASGSDSTLQRTILQCQPFKDGAATLVCVGCFKMLTFPNSARKIKCGGCGTETSGVKIKCTACQEPLRVQLGTTVVRCTKCAYSFQPMAVLKITLPEWARTGREPLTMRLNIVIDTSVSRTAMRNMQVTVVPSQPIRTSATKWEEDSGADFRSVAFFKQDGVKIDASKSPMELHLEDNDVIEIRRSEAQKFGHDFVTSQFGTPTNCALCKEFIWGIYHQGKKCSRCGVPVHHRCAEGMSQMCEADRRAMFGIVNFNDGEDEEDDVEAVIAVVIDDADQVAFSSCVKEAVAPECDKNFMASLNKLSDFTDEQIQAMWLNYDKDNSGTLEVDEMKLFMSDLVGIGGGKWKADGSEAAVERLIRRMDQNGDGVIQWEEFWYFFKAQHDSNYLSQLKGARLDTEGLYELWYHYDSDSSGSLELDELLELLADLKRMQATGAATRAAGAADPSDKFKGKFESLLKPDAAVSWEQFCTVIVPIIKASLE